MTYLDLDEYLTAWNHTGFSLEGLLEQHAASAAPFFRLPWWNVGSDGLETRPKALVIDAYKGGQLQPQHHKTFAKSAECLDFNYTLHTRVLRPDELLPAFNMTRRDFTERESIHPFEMRTMTLGPADVAGTADVPATSMFIKHYIFVSWEEFRVQRANYAHNSAGDPTIWAVDPRGKWLGGNITPRREVAAEFTSHMASRVLASFRQEHMHGHLPCRRCHEKWSL